MSVAYRSAGKDAREEAVGTIRSKTGLRILQVCPTIHQACGVGNFSRNLETALRQEGLEIRTEVEFEDAGEHILLVQHEFALYKDEALRCRLAAWPGNKILFAHSSGADTLTGCVDGFVSMCEGMLQTDKPSLVLRHPGWQNSPLLDRAALKRDLGWSGYRCVVGTNGFISPSRQFDEILVRFMDFAVCHDALVVAFCPRHASHDNRRGYRDQEQRLLELRRRFDRNLQLEMRFLDHEALNRQFQACDLLWCWTGTPSVPYASGTCSDQYGSGTRLVVADKMQHRHVLDLPNTVVAPPQIDCFVETLKCEVLRGQFDRHDPSPLSWGRCADQLSNFLSMQCQVRNPRAESIESEPAADCQRGYPAGTAVERRSAAVGLTPDNAVRRASAFVETIGPYSGRLHGRGIVVCAGGVKHNTCAWVLINLLRWLRCHLPIEVWCYEQEFDQVWSDLVEPLDVRVSTIHDSTPGSRRAWAKWQIKPEALLRSSFREILLLDADNVPVCDPTYLFNYHDYRASGAIFWPGTNRSVHNGHQSALFGVPSRTDAEQDTAQVVIDKCISWKPLNLCRWYHEHGDFFYGFTRGDKETYRVAWQRLGVPYAVPREPPKEVDGTRIQHDLSGRSLFHHRCRDPWSFDGGRAILGFPHEELCRSFVADLGRRWSPLAHLMRHSSAADCGLAAELSGRKFTLIQDGRGVGKLGLQPTGAIGHDAPTGAAWWWVREGLLVLASSEGTPLVHLASKSDASWIGAGSCGAPSLKLKPIAR